MNKLLWTDLTTDEERAEFIRCGRAVETGIMAADICDDVADAFAARAEIDRLRAENEKLKAALVLISEIGLAKDVVYNSVLTSKRMRAAAKAALSPNA